MKTSWKQNAASLLLLFFLTALPGNAQAGFEEKIKLDKGNLKKAAVIGAGAAALLQMKPSAASEKLPEPQKIQIPGIPEEKAPQNKAEKKAAEKTRREKAQSAEEAAEKAGTKIREMAEAGDIQAEYIAGCAAYAGMRAKEDGAQAVYWWQKAAAQGHPDADACVGLSFAEGFGGSLKSMKEALRRYRRAEKNGSPMAAALLGMELYQYGGPEDKTAALALFEKAAARGSAPAKRLLTLILREGTDKRQNFSRVIAWKDEMRKTGLAALCRQAGTNAFRGRIVGQNYGEAVSWWEISAELGDVKARALLGTAYYTGRGAPRDGLKALEYLKAAAAENEPLAQYTLGKAYMEGVIVKKNKELALKLLRAADCGGVKDAGRLVQRLNR